MTAQVEDGHGPIWFFTDTDNALVRNVSQGGRAIAATAELLQDRALDGRERNRCANLALAHLLIDFGGGL